MTNACIMLFSLILGFSASSMDWSNEILQSSRAKVALASQPMPKHKTEQEKASNKEKMRITKDATDANVVADPFTKASLDLLNNTNKKADELVGFGKYEDAYQLVKKLRDMRPDMNLLSGTNFAQYCIFAGHYEEAYQAVVQVVQKRDKQIKKKTKPLSSYHLLTLSLASAMLGDVFAGQQEYCRAQADAGLKEHALINSDLDPKLAKRSDAHGVAILSCLGLGYSCGKVPYLELALKLDPANTMVANELICYYELRERKDDMKRIAEGMLKNLPDSDENREKYQKVIDGN